MKKKTKKQKQNKTKPKKKKQKTYQEITSRKAIKPHCHNLSGRITIDVTAWLGGCKSKLYKYSSGLYRMPFVRRMVDTKKHQF